MENQNIKTVREIFRHWYLPLMLGIIFVFIGVLVFITPVNAYMALTMIFSITFVITGAIEITSSVLHRRDMNNWGWSLTTGILDLIVGLILVSHPLVSSMVLGLFVGFVILFRSFTAITWSIELRKYKVPYWGVLLGIGILGAIFSIILIWNPAFAGMTLVFLTGFAFVAVGIFQIYLSFVLAKIKNRI